MRTDSRCAIRICVEFLGILCLAANVGWGQVQTTNQTLTETPPSPMEASPLSQFSAATPLINRMSQAQRVSGVWLSSPQTTHRGENQHLVTREIDLRTTLQKYAKFKQCTLNEAFAETVSFLKMVPLHNKTKSEMVGAQAVYSIIEQDIYRISAPQSFFDALPLNMLCLENGKRNLKIEIHFLAIPADNPETFKSLMIPGSFVSFNNKIPQVTPYATSATYQDEASNLDQVHPPGGTFVVATETRTKVYPTFMGRLNDQGVKKLVASAKADKNFRITMAPSLVVSPGQTASIADASMRPFVVGLNRVEGDFAVAHQPIVQPVEDGTFLMLRATGEDGKIRLDADLALSEIESVETFGYSDSKPQENRDNTDEASNLTVQIPEQKLKQVHFSTLVEEGHTLLIDPVFKKNVETRIEKRLNLIKNNGKNLKSPKSRVMLMIKPRWVPVN